MIDFPKYQLILYLLPENTIRVADKKVVLFQNELMSQKKFKKKNLQLLYQALNI